MTTQFIYATVNSSYIFINTSKICSLYPNGKGCIIRLENGADVKVKEDQNTIIKRIFNVESK